ncbi:MAG: GNAT family N-acetyltransferase [Firmicutes bacterium]|jgi:ribosomal-protein-alanine N-acetyltransferase|nr:GNAT family N-acetyltransferase [Bacillota bacterium]
MLELLKKENIIEIFTFEVENKSYFEKNLPHRPRGYFEMETFNEIMKEIIEEQGMGLCYMHIIRNEDNKMIGRINLSTFKNEKNELIWTLGYRMDQNANGKGYCSKAIKEVLKIAKEKYKIDKIMAGTAPENKASQRVLEKNGFKYLETIKDDFEINGVMVDTKLYSITLQ